MSQPRCIRHVHLEMTNLPTLLEMLPPGRGANIDDAGRDKLPMPWSACAVRNDDSPTVGKVPFLSKNPPVEQKQDQSHQSTLDDVVFSVYPLISPVKQRKVRKLPTAQLGHLTHCHWRGTGHTPTPPSATPLCHIPCHSQLQVLPPPFPQAPFCSRLRRGSCHDFHSDSSFLRHHSSTSIPTPNKSSKTRSEESTVLNCARAYENALR